jgi:hypothetical protein
MAIDYNALAQAVDTTWGKSSTPKTASYSVKFNMVGERLVATYQVIVNFVSEKEMILMKRACHEESDRVLKSYLTTIKSAYRDLSGSTLKTKETESVDSLEIINFNVHNPKRTAYFRRKVVLDIA